MKLAIVTALTLVSRLAHAGPDVAPLTPAQIARGLALGTVFAIGAGAMAVKLTEGWACATDREQGYEAFEGPCFRRDLYAITVAASVGLGLGFSLVGKLVDRRHSMLINLGGAVLGAATGALISELVVRDGGPSDVRYAGAGLLITLGTPIVGAVAGYVLARPRRNTQPGLLRYDRGQLQLGVPAIKYANKAPTLTLIGGTF